MTPELRQDYLRVLKIPDFLYSNNKDISNKKPIKCLVIECITEYSFCQPGKSYDLLEKMLAAIDLKMNDVSCVCATNKTLSSVISETLAQSILIMGQLKIPRSDKVYITYHPQEILKNPKLKRDVWEALKKIKECLN